MKLTLNDVLDWMQRIDPNGTFDELKDRMLGDDDFITLLDILDRWTFECEDDSKLRSVCNRMTRVVAMSQLASHRPTKIGKIAVMIVFALSCSGEFLPIFVTDGSVSRLVEAYDYFPSSDRLYLHYTLDGETKTVMLYDDADFVSGFYFDRDYPDGYLMIEPEWYSKLGG